METFDPKTPAQASPNDLQSQCDALRHLIVSIMILVIMISGTLNIYLLRQWRTTSKDLDAVRPQARQMIADYQRLNEPLMNDFVKKITEYGRTHPDFAAAVLAKYGLMATAPTGAAPPTSIPRAPSAPPKK